MSIRSKGGVYGSSDSFRIDASEFSALLNDVKAFDKNLGNAIRKRVRDAGKPMVKKMQAAVTDPQSKRSARIVQVRRKQRTGEEVEVRTNTSALVAKGIAFRIATGKTGGAGRFVSSGKSLPPSRKAMFRALNKPKFRHPVFNTGEWVEQAGRPYFGSVILSEQDELLDAINKALDDAAEALGRSRIRGPR